MNPHPNPCTHPQNQYPLIKVEGLRVDYDAQASAVAGVDLAIYPGQVVGLVGESGSGKSTVGFAIAGLLDPETVAIEGTVDYRGVNLLAMSIAGFRRYRQKAIGVVFQDAQTSLNPLLTIGTQLGHALAPGPRLSRNGLQSRKLELLGLVGIPDALGCLKKYPHQLSGGMQQRVIIAAAISCSPALLIADEPTTALDVTVQAQIIELLQDLSFELDMAVLFISHDLALVASFSQWVYVMRKGLMVEKGPTDLIMTRPSVDYTANLMASVPVSRYVDIDWLRGSSFWAQGPPSSSPVRAGIPATSPLKGSHEFQQSTDSDHTTPNGTDHNCV